MPQLKATVMTVGIDPLDKTMAWMNVILERATETSKPVPAIALPQLPPNYECDFHQPSPVPFPIPPQMVQAMNNILRFSLSLGEFNALKPQIGETLLITLSRPGVP
jgi:hypothetical protein